MIRRHPILFTLMLLIIAAVVAGVMFARRPKLTPVRVAKVETVESLKALVNASGEIRAHELVDIQAEVAGVIVELPVVEGQRVSKGDILLRIDPFQAETELAGAVARQAAAQARVKRAETMIAVAEAHVAGDLETLRSSEVDLEQARITSERNSRVLERQRPLVKDGTISEDQFEVYESTAKISAKQVEAAEARIEQIRAQLKAGQLGVEEQQSLKVAAEQDLVASDASLERVRDMLDKVTIASPLNGVIIRLNVDIGERAVPGIQSNPQATLMTIANLSRIEAEIRVDETEIVRVAVDQRAVVEVDALADTELKGRVVEIGSAPIPGTGGQEGKDFKVILGIDDPPDTLRVGMSCEADITVDTRENVLGIPIQSLTRREVDVDADGNYAPPPKPDPKKKGKPVSAKEDDPKKEKAEKSGVFVKSKDNFARFRVVEPGVMGEGKVEIVAGLEEGEEVITGPLTSLRILEEWTAVKLADK